MIRALVILLVLVAITGCGSLPSWWSRPTPPPEKPAVLEAPPSPSVLVGTPSSTPKEDAAVKEARKRVTDLEGQLDTARREEKAVTQERDAARREAEVRPVRYIFVAGAALGALAVLAGVALWALSLVWSFGFGGKFGLSIAGVGATVMGICLLFLWLIAVALAHFVAICSVIGSIIAIAIAWGVWHLTHRGKVSVAQTLFGDAAAAKLKALQAIATDTTTTADNRVLLLERAAATAWEDVSGPAIEHQVKSGVRSAIDRLRAHIASKAA